jgi:hypothetical protein
MTWLDGSTLVYVPAGEFVMGDGSANAPVHTVNLSGYWIQQAEVTSAMYVACLRAGACKGIKNVTDPVKANRPVVGLMWSQARNYCDWIQGRLPTEAEWERAAQGPGSAAYPWGSEAPDCTRANFGECKRPLGSVGGFQQGVSPLGIFDMSGNAAEWVGDWYDPNYYRDAPSDDPVGPASGTVRVVRGGSYASDAAQVSAYARAYEKPKYNRADLGFRCVVPTPALFPAFCQAEPFVPAAETAGEAVCQPPETTLRGSYCQKKKGYVTLDIPAGARWQLETPGFTCSTENISAEIDRLTCYGQGNLDLKVTVCSSTCFGDFSGLEPSCPAGYTRDLPGSKCVYKPAAAGICPDGFSSLSEGHTSICVPAPASGVCPVGQYFDVGINACLPGGSQASCLIYGLETSETAPGCYQGCSAGYSYDEGNFCCQSKTGAYLGCGFGYTYDETLRACVPGAGLGGEGCETVSMRTGACVDCGIYPNCNPGCQAHWKTQTCIMR